MKSKNIAIASIALIATLAGANSAIAATFNATADRTSGLASVGDKVNVTLTDIPAEQGVYVRLCAGSLTDVATARPANCFGQGAWVSTSAAAQAQGAGDASKVVSLAVQAQFTSGSTAVDCTLQACGIHIRRDHMGGATDYSLDRFIPVSFGVAAVAKTSATLSAGKVNFEIVGQKGKLVSFKYGSKAIEKRVTSDDFKASMAVASNTKTLNVSISVAGKALFSKKLTLTN